MAWSLAEVGSVEWRLAEAVGLQCRGFTEVESRSRRSLVDVAQMPVGVVVRSPAHNVKSSSAVTGGGAGKVEEEPVC